ncbi:MAG: membrane or secreted protein [Bacteroidia bacterium]|nr:membrane or secreted protein [Bacteroidia bacterium]
MKILTYTGLLIALLTAGLFPNSIKPHDNATLTGAWTFVSGSTTTTTIFSDKYFATATYDKDGKTFAGTAGGSWKVDGKNLVLLYEFNTLHPEQVGTSVPREMALKGKSMTLANDQTKETWNRLDDGTPGKLAGAWLITGRYNNGELRTMTPGARRTMKILSGTRFQWIAYNVDTKEFFGTGGGTYTTADGKLDSLVQRMGAEEAQFLEKHGC